MLIVAVDWSGDNGANAQRNKIWTAEVRDGQLEKLTAGRTRAETIQHLINLAAAEHEVVVGLDFAFSCPAWYVARLGARDVNALWAHMAREADTLLADCDPPLWGRPGVRRPVMPLEYRRTELDLVPIGGIRPASVFKIG